MSAQDDLLDYPRDDTPLFLELEERQQTARRLVTPRELVDALERAGFDLRRSALLKRQLVRLGQISGLSRAESQDKVTATLVEIARMKQQRARDAAQAASVVEMWLSEAASAGTTPWAFVPHSAVATAESTRCDAHYRHEVTGEIRTVTLFRDNFWSPELRGGEIARQLR